MVKTDRPSTPTVLVVDDEKGLRDMLLFNLSERGYRVSQAADGNEALDLARKQDFDLAVCDIMMPGEDGVKTLRRLKEIRPETEIVMATGCATVETAVESMKLGAYDYITKPYTVAELEAVLARALERRQLKEKVGQLEQVNRLKSEFLANMSHELRTPLNAIVGYTALILDKAYGDVPTEQAEALRRVFVSSKNLLELINNILDLSKLNAGMMPAFMEEFNLVDTLQEVVDTTQALAIGKGIELSCLQRPALRMRSDKTRIKQILINLVGNAIKFTAKGEVSLAAELAADGSSVEIRVKDTGPGIAEADIPRIFEEFKQLDGGADREHGGTGLGLSITRKLVELLSGTISVESSVGAGSTFVVILPKDGSSSRDSGLSSMPVTFPVAARGDKKTLLAIDDDPEVLKILADSLRGTEYEMVGATNAEDGLALAGNLKPFAITLDIMMPHRDGWSVLQTLKRDRELRSIPVIVLSILENKALGYALGVTDYIVKPFDRPLLLEKLKAIETTARRRILVVDDEPEIVELFREALKSEGYEVATASSGKEAMASLRQTRPDMLFLDLTLPDTSGFDILKELEGLPDCKNLPVIILTAQNLKPAELARLERRVEMIIQKGSFRVPEILAQLRSRLAALSMNEYAR